ncbi:sodium bile acid symporter family protein [Peptococcaceae bacterium CEB3]|nr:sodium bile acid symporter family protein [Peptococcaceae bacterium CEB3]
MTTWENHRLIRIMVFVVSRLMPVWILVFAAVAFRFSSFFSGLGSYVGLGLGSVMFFTGIALDLTRLVALLKKPLPVVFGSMGKWIFASALSVILASLFFGLHTPTAAGIVMAGIVPSGTSANLNSLIGGGDVAYSITMSALDTVIGPILTPLLAKLFLRTYVHIAYFTFVWKMLRLVFLPLVSGVLIQTVLPRVKKLLMPVTPIISALALYGVVLGIVSGASDVLVHSAGALPLIGFAVTLQVGTQMMIGYLYGRALRLGESSCRSLVFEIGISNSALAAVLSNEVYGSLAAVAAIANMVCNLTMGGLLAALLRRDSDTTRCKNILEITTSAERSIKR